MYSSRPLNTSCKKSARHIPSLPERILDAPEIVDDYCTRNYFLFYVFSLGMFVFVVCFLDLNLLDWSANNILAVGLAGQVFLWNAGSGDIELLMEMESSTDYVSSLACVKEGNYLAVGTSDSQVQVCTVMFFSMLLL